MDYARNCHTRDQNLTTEATLESHDVYSATAGTRGKRTQNANIPSFSLTCGAPDTNATKHQML